MIVNRLKVIDSIKIWGRCTIIKTQLNGVQSYGIKLAKPNFPCHFYARFLQALIGKLITMVKR